MEPRNLIELLSGAGDDALGSGSGEQGYELATTRAPDSIVLDLTLPGRDGLNVLGELRADGSSIPVLILTARDAIEDRVAGLDRGADDYLVKPFAHAEFLARVRALLRRSAAAETVLRCGDLQLDVLGRTVVRDGSEIELSQREFELLEYLVRHKETHVTREMLSRDVWKEPYGMYSNAIDVCVNSLRRRIDKPGNPSWITTVRGVGYTMRDRE